MAGMAGGQPGKASEVTRIIVITAKDTVFSLKSIEVKAGESYQSKKESEKAGNLEILQYTDTATPKGQMVLNNVILYITFFEEKNRIETYTDLADLKGVVYPYKKYIQSTPQN